MISITPTNSVARSRYKATFYDLRQPNIHTLAAEICNYDWSSVLDITDIDLAYEGFLSAVDILISLNIPCHTVTLTDSTPKYITPLIKSLLRKRNKLMRKGKIADANCLSLKIGKLLTETREKQLVGVNHKDIKRLWSSVRPTTSPKSREISSAIPFTANDMVGYFTEVATTHSLTSVLPCSVMPL